MRSLAPVPTLFALVFFVMTAAFSPAMAQVGPFQPGVTPLAMLAIPPGESRELAAYCGDALAAPPYGAIQMLADPGVGEVQLAGWRGSVRDAQANAMVVIRGHDDSLDDPITSDTQLDLHVFNPGPYPLTIRLEAGTVLTPAGQQRPFVDPGVAKMLALEGKDRRAGSPVAALAMWGATGSSLQDVAEQAFVFPSDALVRSAQSLMDQAGIGPRLDRGDSDYAALYDHGIAGLGAHARSTRLHLKLSDGTAADGSLTRDGDVGVVRLTLRSFPKAPAKDHSGSAPTSDLPPLRRLYYLATVEDVISGGYSLTLLQPKTGQPIPGSGTIHFE